MVANLTPAEAETKRYELCGQGLEADEVVRSSRSPGGPECSAKEGRSMCRIGLFYPAGASGGWDVLGMGFGWDVLARFRVQFGASVIQTSLKVHWEGLSDLVRAGPKGRLGRTWPYQELLVVYFPKKTRPIDLALLRVLGLADTGSHVRHSGLLETAL